jgi:hypothetical protein
MIPLDALLSSRPSLTLAALFVTWVAVALLGLIAVGLHIRVQQLESGSRQREPAVPFGHLLGRTLGDLLNGSTPSPLPRLLLFVSSGCPVCRQLLSELRATDWDVPAAIVWTDAAEVPPAMPRGIALVPDGPKVSAALGVRVTPFALVLGRDGRIAQASPVNSLAPLRDALERSARQLAMVVPATH